MWGLPCWLATATAVLVAGTAVAVAEGGGETVAVGVSPGVALTVTVGGVGGGSPPHREIKNTSSSKTNIAANDSQQPRRRELIRSDTW